MKGVILAGGSGSRLKPLTDITNKHLLPVYDQPMIHFPLETLVKLGIEDVLLVTAGRWIDDFQMALGNGESFGLRSLSFAAQTEPRGIVDALRLAEEFSAGEPLAVILGDNLLEIPPLDAVQQFKAKPHGAKIFLTTVDDPSDLGVAVLTDGRVTELVEKPSTPISNQAVIGLYLYDSMVFERISKLKPSARGEYEITDLNKSYLQSDELTASELSGWWRDCGTFDALLSAANLVSSADTSSRRSLTQKEVSNRNVQ